LNTSVSYKIRVVANFVADISVPVIAPLAEAEVNAAPLTAKELAVAIVNAALLAALLIALVAGALGTYN
jgi:hypothetical protein